MIRAAAFQASSSALLCALALGVPACSDDGQSALDLADGLFLCPIILDDDLGSDTDGIVDVLADDAESDAAWILYLYEGRHYLGRRGASGEAAIDPFDLGTAASKTRRLFADLNPGRAWILEEGVGAPTYIYELQAGSGVVRVSGDVSDIPGSSGQQGGIDRTLMSVGGRLSVMSTYQQLPGATIELYLLELSQELEALALWTLELPAADGDSAFSQPYLAFGRPGPAAATPGVVGLERQRAAPGQAIQTDLIQLRLRWQDDAPVATYLETFDDGLIHNGSPMPLETLDIGIDPRRSWQLATVFGAPNQTSFTAIDWIGASAEFSNLTVPSSWSRPRLLQVGAYVVVLALKNGRVGGAILRDITTVPVLEDLAIDGIVDILPAGNGHATAVAADGRTLYVRLSCDEVP